MTSHTKKNILIVITKSNFGGAQKYVYDLATSLKESGFRVNVALGGNGILKNKLIEEGLETFSIPGLDRNISIFKEFSVLLELIRIIKKTKPDILHLNSSKIGGIGSVAGRLTGVKKIIFTIHGWAFNENRSAFSKIIIKFLYWLTILLSHKSITVSNKTRNEAPKWPFIKNKIVVVYNGVKNPDFIEKHKVRNFIKNKFPKIDENKKWIITLSELHHIKGLDYLLKSALELKDINVNFIIFGEGEERKNLEKFICENDLENKVFLAGFVENGSKYLKGFDIFLMTSISEAMPLSILEAGLANIPVIATRVGGIPEIIEDNISGYLIEPKNHIEISNKIKSILENPEKSLEMANNLNLKIKNDLSFNKMLNKTIAVYDSKD